MQTENTYIETDLGNIALNPRGEYSDETSYEYLDTVSYMGGSYVCLTELTKTISGIAPTQGKNTEYWQMLTLPGGLTSDYIAMHDDVVNKAKQVETSRAAAELSQQEVEAAQADVRQMRQDTQEAAEETASSRDSAAGYAQSAETSRTAAKESEDNINAQVTGFDTHVAEKTSAAESAITEARQTAVNTVSAKQDDAVQAVTGEGNKQVKNVGDAGTEQVGKVKSAGASAVSAAGAAGESAVNAVKTQQTASIKTIQEAGENALQNISDGVDKGLSEEGKAADAKVTGEAISNLTEDISNKITKFYAPNQGETHLADSDNGKIQDMMLYGKSSQFTTTGKNLANGQNINCFINSAADTCGVSSDDIGMVIDVSKLTNVSISTRSIQDRYRFACANTVPTKRNPITCYNGTSKDGTKDSYTMDTTGYNYLFINVTKLEDIQAEKGLESTSYEPYTGGIPSPSPDYPQEIKSVVNPIVKLSNEDGTQSETVTLPYALNAIPVSSGGNVTIDGQQYIADYVDVERGKLVKRVYEYVFSGEDSWNTAADGAQYLAWRVGDNPGIIDSTYDKKCLCSCLIANIMNTTRKGENYISTQSFDDTCRVWVSANVATSKLTGEKVFLTLIVPEEISLTQEEIRAFKELAAYYPVTNVNVASEQLNGYTVFNYPVSMKNGWNYVKQQLNDNRDYIYDMDLQSAEAYINSEYAVALTELEV